MQDLSTGQNNPENNSSQSKFFGAMKIVGILLAFFLLGAAIFLVINNKKTADDPQEEKNNINPGMNLETEEFLLENIPFNMPSIKIPKFPSNVCSVEKYGAIGDGKYVNTQSIEKAMEDCYQKGGGKVVFPEGKWLTGSIHLKSNINLYLEKDAEIIFTTNFEDYLPAVFSRFQGIEYYNFSPPIYAKDCENIALTGDGKIVGNGEFWEKWAENSEFDKARKKLFAMSGENTPVEKRIFSEKSFGMRPSFIQFVNCRNILVEGLTIENGPMWTIHPIYSENIVIRNAKINTYSANTDGFVIDSSENVLVENSNFSTGDDSIAIKSGLEDEGIRMGRPSENIVIRNSNFIKGHGAVAIGSEMSGGVRNVFVKDCFFDGTSSGLRIKTTRSRGGFIENIWISDARMNQLEEEAVVFNFDYTSALKNKEASRVPILRNIYIKNISGNSAKRAISVAGLKDGKMENIFFENFEFQSENKSELKFAKNIEFKNVSLKIKNQGPVFVIENSQNIKFENFKCDNLGGICFNIKGENTSNIDFKESNIGKDKISFTKEL